MLDTVQGAATDALEDLRDLARGIYPPLLADKGLPDAIAAQARRAAIPVEVEADGVGRYPQDVEAAVYFCTLEALNNVAKYAEAANATVRLAQDDGHLTFTVVDDGRGFDTGATAYGTGCKAWRTGSTRSAVRWRSRARSALVRRSSAPSRLPRACAMRDRAIRWGRPHRGWRRPGA